MGLVEQILSTSLPQHDDGLRLSLLESLFDLFSNPVQGGFIGLVADFHKHGLGEAVDSWIGDGKNLAVTVARLRQALGEERVRFLADATNLSPQRIVGDVTELIPVLVSALTPEGKLPDQAGLTKCLGFLRSRLLVR